MGPLSSEKGRRGPGGRGRDERPLFGADVAGPGGAAGHLPSGRGFLIEPSDVEASIESLRMAGIRPKVTILDPWYNKGVGGVRDDYDDYIAGLLRSASGITDHIYLWGFPEIIARFVGRLPEPFVLTAWLTWYYKNNPSVIKGWRSSQMACLHLSRPGARLYPEHFLNEAQRRLQAEGKLRYMPGPTSVIEGPLLVGFVGRKEQTGHPAQKPVCVYEPLILMSTKEGDLVFDPMCGSGTTGEACARLGRPYIVADHSPDYVALCEKRLGLTRRPGRDLGPFAAEIPAGDVEAPIRQAAG